MSKYVENSSDVNVEGIDFYVSEFNPFSEGYAVYTEDPEKYIGLKELSHAFYMNDIVLVLGSGYKCRPDAIKEGLKGTDPETGNEVDYCMIYFYDEVGNRSTITSYDKYISPEPPGPEPGQSILPIPEQYRKNGYIGYADYRNGNRVRVGEKINPNDLTVIWNYEDDNDLQQQIELTKEYYGISPYDASVLPVSIDDYVIDDYYLNKIKIAVNPDGSEYNYIHADIQNVYLSDDDPNKDRITDITIIRNPNKLIYIDEDDIDFEGLEFIYTKADGSAASQYISDNSTFEINIDGYAIKPFSFIDISLNSNINYYNPGALAQLNSNYQLPSINSIKEALSYVDDVKFMNIIISLFAESYPDDKRNFINGINYITQKINIFVDNDNVIGENDLVISNISLGSLNNSIKRVFETSENITADEFISQTVINSQSNQPGISARLYLADGSFVDKSMTELKEIIDQGGTGLVYSFNDSINYDTSTVGEGDVYINVEYSNSKLYNYNDQEIEIFDPAFGVNNKQNPLFVRIWTVEERIPTSMFIGFGPTKTSYVVGESFDPTGMSVSITGFSGVAYGDNDSETIPNESIEYVHDAQNPYTSDDISSEYAETISYTENETTISTSQIVSVSQNV